MDPVFMTVTARKGVAVITYQFLGAAVWLLAWVLGFFVMFVALVGHRNRSSGMFGDLAVDIILLAFIGGLALRVAARRSTVDALKRRLRIAGSVCYSISFMALFAIFMAAMASL
jgi:hypothetical protein